MFARGDKVAVMSMDGKNRASYVSILSRIQPVMRDGRGGQGEEVTSSRGAVGPFDATLDLVWSRWRGGGGGRFKQHRNTNTHRTDTSQLD